VSKAQALAEKLKQARKAAGLSQVELAQKLGRSQSYVTKVENGHMNVGVIELITYCSVLGVDPAKLVKSLTS
jgi:transcriptional regulator with XRE-family HTH domain